MSVARRAPSPALIALAVAAIVGGIATLAIGPWPVGSFQDDGMYLVLAKSLASGQGYRYLNLPGAPAGTHFPPGYPALLALLWRLAPSFPANVAVFKLANALLLGAAAAGALHLGRTRLGLSTTGSAIATVVGATAVPMLALTGLVMSEPLFLALLFPALALAERAVERDARPAGWRDATVAGLACGALTLVRSIGIVAVAALLLVLLARRRWRHATLAFVGAAVLLAPWQLWMRGHAGELPAALQGKYGDYTSWAIAGMRAGGPDFVGRVAWANARELAVILGGPFSLDGVHTLAGGAVVQAIACVVVPGLLVIGLAGTTRRASVVTLFTVGYFAFVVAWPFPPNRFAWTIWPLLALLVAAGATVVARRARMMAPAVWRVVPVLVASPLVALFAWQAWGAVSVRDWSRFARATTPSVTAEAEWVARHTRPDEIVASDVEFSVYLYTGRRAVPTGDFRPEDRVQPFATGRGERVMREIVDGYDARWVVLSDVSGVVTAKRLTEQSPPALRLADVMPVGAVFARVRP